MSDTFNLCPQCGSDEIEQTDYEIEGDNGGYEENADGRACTKCRWEGDVSELVCKD